MVSEPPPHPTPPQPPPTSLSPNQLAQAARAWQRPQYAPRVERAVRAPRRVRGLACARKKRRRSTPPPPRACVSMTATCKKRAVVESSRHRLCLSHAHKCSQSLRAVSRSPPRHIIVVKDRIPLPRATDVQVHIGKATCTLISVDPSRTRIRTELELLTFRPSP